MLSRLLGVLVWAVDVDRPVSVSGVEDAGGGAGGARVGRCCETNLLRPSRAGPGAIEPRSRVPTPRPPSWRLLRWRWWPAPGGLEDRGGGGGGSAGSSWNASGEGREDDAAAEVVVVAVVFAVVVACDDGDSISE